MTIITKIITSILTILVFSCNQLNQTEVSGIYQFSESNDFTNSKYIKNYDGDTVTFDLSNCNRLVFCNNILVRIANIDTPEIRSKNKCEKDLALFAKNLVATEL